MLDAALQAVGLVEGRTLGELKSDEVRSLALVHLLEILGEAASGVSADAKSAHPELPWAKMAATRNRLIHGYFSIDLDIVWRVSKEDLPPVIDTLLGLLEGE